MLTHPLPYRFGAADFWPTPPAAVRALLAHVPPDPGRVLEPAAGSGAICRELLAGGWEPHAVELRSEELPGLVRLCPTTIGDWLGIVRDPCALNTAAGGARQLITNPPFSLATEYREACLGLPAAVYVALMLPTGQLHGQGRLAVNRDLPPAYLLPFADRLSFDGYGTPPRDVAWWVWTRQDPGDPWGRDHHWKTEIIPVLSRDYAGEDA